MVKILTPLPRSLFKGINGDFIFTKMGVVFTGDAVLNYRGKNLIFLGLCGKINKKLKIGDITVPSDCLINESFSDIIEKGIKKKIIKTEPDVLRKIEKFENIKITRNVTFPSLKMEKKFLKVFKELKIDTVDMELSTVLSASKFKKIKLFPFLIVSDTAGRDDFSLKSKNEIRDSIIYILKIIKNLGVRGLEPPRE